VARELTIGQLSARSGVSQSALRFYERKGLIAAQRSDGNQRRYPPVTLRRVALVQAGKTAGIPLERIRDALDTLPADRAPTKRDWERLSRRWRKELDLRIATLEGVRDRLTGCIGCGCLSLRRCALLNPGDEAAQRGPGAHYLVPQRRAAGPATVPR
jgi:MerR family redox-sensitive transcriptional activator SoxR